MPSLLTCRKNAREDAWTLLWPQLLPAGRGLREGGLGRQWGRKPDSPVQVSLHLRCPVVVGMGGWSPPCLGCSPHSLGRQPTALTPRLSLGEVALRLRGESTAGALVQAPCHTPSPAACSSRPHLTALLGTGNLMAMSAHVQPLGSSLGIQINP